MFYTIISLFNIELFIMYIYQTPTSKCTDLDKKCSCSRLIVIYIIHISFLYKSWTHRWKQWSEYTYSQPRKITLYRLKLSISKTLVSPIIKYMYVKLIWNSNNYISLFNEPQDIWKFFFCPIQFEITRFDSASICNKAFKVVNYLFIHGIVCFKGGLISYSW